MEIVTEKHKVKKEKEEKMEKKEMEASKPTCEEAETPAAKTIQAHPSDASKAALMARAVTAIEGMEKSEAATWLDKALALIGHEADMIPNDAAQKNLATIAAKTAVKEDFDALCEGQDFSEDFKEKSSVLFDVAVTTRLLAEKAKLEEEYEKLLGEHVDTYTQTLTDQLDQYLSYIAEEWKKENEVAIDTSLRAEVAEEFINGLRNLFAEHYIEFPEDKVDAVEVLASEVEELKDKLNESMKTNMEMSSLIEEYVKKEIFDEVMSSLALTQVDKIRPLIEDVEFESPEAYRKKIGIIKENYTNTINTSSKAKPTSFITEEITVDSAEVKYVDKTIANYASAISRTIKK